MIAEKSLEESEIFGMLDEDFRVSWALLCELWVWLEASDGFWKCDSCDAKLGVGSKFYHRSTLEDSVDYCRECYGKIEEAAEKNDLDFIDVENEDLFSVRSRKISIISLAETSERKLDPRIQLSKKGTQEWLDSIPRIYHVPVDFGSIRNWAAVSPLYDIPFMPVDTILLIDTVKNRAALGLINKEGFLSLHIVYTNIDSYLSELEVWKTKKATEEERAKSLRAIREDLKSRTCSSLDLSNLIDDFSGYLAVTNEITKGILGCYVTFKN